MERIDEESRESFMGDMNSAIVELEKAEEVFRFAVANGVNDAAITNVEASYLLGCSKSLVKTIEGLRRFGMPIPWGAEIEQCVPEPTSRKNSGAETSRKAYFGFIGSGDLVLYRRRGGSSVIHRNELIKVFAAVLKGRNLKKDYWYPREDIAGISGVPDTKVKIVRRAMKEAGIIVRVGAGRDYGYYFRNEKPETWLECMESSFSGSENND